MKNERAPRTLAEAEFWTGYQSINPKPEPSPQWWSWALATAIGVSFGYLLARSI